jgi:hypothetical protein
MTDEQKENEGIIPPKSGVPNVNGNGKKPDATPPPAKGMPSTVRMVRLKSPSEKSETSRIDLSEAEVPAPSAAQQSGLNVRDVFKRPDDTPKAAPASPKSDTSRVDVPAGGGQEGDSSKMGRTARISLDAIIEEAEREAQKDMTSHIHLDTAKAAEPGVSDATSRVSLGEAPPKSATQPRPIKTVRLQRPSAMPKTVVLSRQDAPAVEAPRPTVAESIKQSTAKIDVPGDMLEASPVTQRKTIRIKRPDAGSSIGGAKTVTLARPPIKLAGTAQKTEGSPAVARTLETLETVEEDVPGTGFSVLALVATLVAAALIYLLAAEMAGWPLPGRIVPPVSAIL